jgi:hypothetical protein
MLKTFVTTLLLAALGLLGYDASMRARVVRDRGAVTTPAADSGGLHTMDGGDGIPIKP